MEEITPERWALRDHYRAQINADKAHVAFGYGAISEYFPRTTSDEMRNSLASVWEMQLESSLRLALALDPAFGRFVTKFIDTMVHPDLQAAAHNFFTKCGWRRALL